MLTDFRRFRFICVFPALLSLLFLSCTSSRIASDEGELVGVVKVPYDDYFKTRYLKDSSIVLVRKDPQRDVFLTEHYDTNLNLLWSQALDWYEGIDIHNWMIVEGEKGIHVIAEIEDDDQLLVLRRSHQRNDGAVSASDTLVPWVDWADNVNSHYLRLSPDSSLVLIARRDFIQLDKTEEPVVDLTYYLFDNDMQKIASGTTRVNIDPDIDEVKIARWRGLTSLYVGNDSCLYTLAYKYPRTAELLRLDLRTASLVRTSIDLGEYEMDDDDTRHQSGFIEAVSPNSVRVLGLLGEEEVETKAILISTVQAALGKVENASVLIPDFDDLEETDLRRMHLDEHGNLYLFLLQGRVHKARTSTGYNRVYTPKTYEWGDLFLLAFDKDNNFLWRDRVPDFSTGFSTVFAHAEGVDLIYSMGLASPFVAHGVFCRRLNTEGRFINELHLLNTYLDIEWETVRHLGPGEFMAVLGSGDHAQLVKVKY